MINSIEKDCINKQDLEGITFDKGTDTVYQENLIPTLLRIKYQKRMEKNEIDESSDLSDTVHDPNYENEDSMPESDDSEVNQSEDAKEALSEKENHNTSKDMEKENGGHTHLEADTDHALVEKQIKKSPAFQIATPWDWQQLVRITSPKFTVIDMSLKDFLNFTSLFSDKNSAFIRCRKSESGDLLRISEAVRFQVKSAKPGHLFFKTKFTQAEFEEVNFNRRHSQNACNLILPPIRE
ncbi:unnamed protein product [Acanthoscelides obtectus]|uniref:Uncharacterized protein n=1 Tax=Acanthoscelides obtectus TaxID=200917 RepID=A0A9P0KK33_ACAOB|nr:unnamed protein product [Acanthoscelides obtectus]CAK1681695.1 hypothetical protein AOBTE_LOCUS33223 [Acanthoscelides obtectus]